MKTNIPNGQESFLQKADSFFKRHWKASLVFIIGGAVFLAVVGLPHGFTALFTHTK